MNTHAAPMITGAKQSRAVAQTNTQRAQELGVDPDFLASVYEDARTVQVNGAEIRAILATRSSELKDLRDRLRTQLANTARDREVVALAHTLFDDEGETEIDPTASVSDTGEENGAYVQAWLWVSFDGTPLDRAQPAPQRTH